MRPTTWRRFSVFLALLWTIQPLATGQSPSPASENPFERAREATNMELPGTPGFVKKGDIRVWLKRDKPVDGKYLYVWSPEGRWKEEIVFPGYRRTRIGDGIQMWQIRSTGTETPVTHSVSRLLRDTRPPRVQDKKWIGRSVVEKIASSDAECYELELENRSHRPYCFDQETGDLLRSGGTKDAADVPWAVVWETYSDYQGWSGKRYARLLRGYNGKQETVEIHLEELQALPPVPPDFFAPAPGATVWMDCRDGQAWRLKTRVPPHYPESARMQHRDGTVMLYAVIDNDGVPGDLRIGHSAGAELDQSALTAVAQWRYERTAACSEAKGPAETWIDVIFSLRF